MGAAYAREAITVADTAIGFTVALINGHRKAKRVMAMVKTAQIMVLWNGTTPTSSIGNLLSPGDIIDLDEFDDILRFRAIRVSSSGELEATYY